MSSPASHARNRPRKARPAWAWLLPGAMLASAAVIPLVVWYAASAILNSTDGNLTQAVSDPAAPGYEVLVVPSPSHMVLSLDPDGDLSSVTVISLASNDRGGTALFIPAEAVVVSSPAGGPDRRLLDVFQTEGEDATRLAAATLIDINVDDLTVLDAAGWSQIVAAVSPLPVDLASDLVATKEDGSTTVVFPAGNTEVTAERASEFLSWTNPDEGRAERLVRQVEFWDTWVAAIAASADPSAVPGEASSGFGRMLRGLASGQAVIHAADSTPATLADGSPALQVDQAELRNNIVEMIPFPVPVTSGARPRVRLLDGVGGLDVASAYARDLVASGAEIVIIGNAASFGLNQTIIIYHDERFAPQAQAFSEDLGGAAVSFEPIADAVLDVTVIIGDDQGLALGE